MSVTIFHRTLGLNTNVDPAAFTRSQDGRVYLMSCNNVVTGDNGRLNRCIGLSAVVSGACHSVHSTGQDLYFCQGNTVYSLDGEIPKAIGTLDSDAPIRCHSIFNGREHVTFFASEAQCGIISRGAISPWVKGAYHGPETAKRFDGPIPGHLLAYGMGRMWIASGNSFWMSLPGNPYLYRQDQGRFTGQGRITMLVPVARGVWFSDPGGIFFMPSEDGASFPLVKKADYPALEGVPPEITAGTLPFDGAGGTGHIVPTLRGFCYLGDDGAFINLTQRVLELRKPDRTFIDLETYSAVVDRNRLYFYSAGLGLIMNLSNLAVTQASAYPMNSACNHGEQIYVANDSGLFTEGAELLDSEFSIIADMERPCRLRRIFISGQFVGGMRVTAWPDDGAATTYTGIPKRAGLRQTEFEFTTHRNNGYGRFWKFKFENINGADFSVDFIKATPVYINR